MEQDTAAKHQHYESERAALLQRVLEAEATAQASASNAVSHRSRGCVCVRVCVCARVRVCACVRMCVCVCVFHADVLVGLCLCCVPRVCGGCFALHGHGTTVVQKESASQALDVRNQYEEEIDGLNRAIEMGSFCPHALAHPGTSMRARARACVCACVCVCLCFPFPFLAVS